MRVARVAFRAHPKDEDTMPQRKLSEPPVLAVAGRTLPDGVQLRRFTPGDLEAAESLTRDVKWPHRLEDWRFSFSLGEGLVAVREQQVFGTALRWRWGKRHATLGMVIVAAQLQGRRVGQHLMQSLLDGLDDRSALLHATAEGRGLYERVGFCATGEIRQHQGIATPAQLVALAEDERLRPLGRNDAKALIALDTLAAGMPRDPLIRALLAQGDTVVLARGSEAVGFSVLRRFGRGHVIGPVVAPDLASAQALIGYWCSRQAGRFVRIDIDASSGLAEWLETLGLQRVGMATPMVRGAAIQRGPALGGWALVNQAMG